MSTCTGKRRPEPYEKGKYMRFRSTILPALLLLCLSSTSGAAEPWKYMLETDLTLTQSYYTDNWAGGEVGNITWVWNFNLLASKQFAENWNNRNTLRLKYGMTHSQDSETGDWRHPEKSDDQIDFETIFRYTKWSSVDPYGSVRFESQFQDRGEPGHYLYVNPMRFTESLGLAKVLSKTEERHWLVRFGLAARQVVTRDVLDPMDDTRSTETQHDEGLMLDTDYRVPFSGGKLVYSGKLNVYQALANSESENLAGTSNADYWKTPDIRWEQNLMVGITGYLAMNLYLDWRYDKDIDLAGRLKQTLGLALVYKFGNIEEEG
jgi:hypothetical protein